MDLPDRVNDSSAFPTINTNVNAGSYPGTGFHASVSVQFQSIFNGWYPFTTHLNMGMTNTVNRTNDCIGYINKLAAIGTNFLLGSPLISASANSYGNTNWYFDDTEVGYGGDALGLTGAQAVIQTGVSSSSITYTNVYPDPYNYTSHIYNGTNLAGYFSWGFHSSLNRWYAIDGTVKWYGHGGWYLIQTIESSNGRQYADSGNFIYWYQSNAFGGTNYSNTPIGAVSNTDEPYLPGNNNPAIYFGLWAGGKNFGVCAWASRNTPYFQAIGDPLITR
jgi:hypothetical protein